MLIYLSFVFFSKNISCPNEQQANLFHILKFLNEKFVEKQT
jgi:hypothetical protein